MNNLKTIESAIQRLEAMYDCNHEVMDADDCGDLLKTIDDLKSMRRKLRYDEHKAKIIAFRDHVLATMPVDSDNDFDEEKWQAFYSLDWTIRYGGEEIQLDNCACVFSAIDEMLDEYINDVL